jgi:hypothetical protein
VAICIRFFYLTMSDILNLKVTEMNKQDNFKLISRLFVRKIPKKYKVNKDDSLMIALFVS